jgi:hypothetical protein
VCRSAWSRTSAGRKDGKPRATAAQPGPAALEPPARPVPRGARSDGVRRGPGRHSAVVPRRKAVSVYPSRSCGVWNGKLNQSAPTAKKPSPASLLQGVAAEASFGYDETVMEGSRPRRALPTSQGTVAEPNCVHVYLMPAVHRILTKSPSRKPVPGLKQLHWAALGRLTYRACPGATMLS